MGFYIATAIIMVALLATFIYLINLLHLRAKYIEKLKKALESKTAMISELEISCDNLEEMLDESLQGQLQLIRFIDNFSPLISEENKAVFADWRMKISKVKEAYVERWREAGQNRKK